MKIAELIKQEMKEELEDKFRLAPVEIVETKRYDNLLYLGGNPNTFEDWDRFMRSNRAVVCLQ